MKRFAALIAGRPAAVLSVLAVLTALALQGIVDLRTGTPRIRVDPAIDRLLPEDDEERLFYDRARQIFGDDEFVLLVAEANDVFHPDVLAAVQRITDRLEREPDVSRVVSLANAVHTRGFEGDLIVGPFFEEVPEAPEALQELRERVMGHPIYGGSLVAKDARATAVLVFTERLSDLEFVQRDFGGHLGALAREASGLSIDVTGSSHVKARLSRTIVSELSFILPCVMGITILLSALAFRSVRGVMLPLSAIGLALVWTLGIMGWSGATLNLVSNIIPPLIITLGFASAVHVVSEYQELLSEAGEVDRAAHRGVVRRLLEGLGLTIAMNGLTTMLGFGSLCVSSVLAIREFGSWAVVGVFLITFSSLTFLPAMLAVLGPPRRLRPREHGGRGDAFASRFASFDIRHRRGILAGGGALLALALVGMSLIEVSTGFVSNFTSRSEVRTTFERVDELLGGISSFTIVIESDEDGAFTRPENLRELRDLQTWLAAQPEIAGTTSLADGVMLLHQAFLGDDPAGFSIPERQRLVKQLLLFGGDQVTRGFVDGNQRIANVTVRTSVSESGDVARLVERVQERLDALPQRLRARPTGSLVLLARTMDDIVRGQLESIALAIVTIYLTLSVLLTSLRVGLYALLPNLIPIAAYYGTLGLVGIPLNLSTSLIGAITLGIAVDDTIHFFSRFAREARVLGDEVSGVRSTLVALFRPVTFTSVGLVLGFCVLMFSELQNQVLFGLLSAFTISIAWLLDVTLSPAICAGVRIVTLWDLLGLDLGPEPERSIRLFEGLSGRQARVVALMTSLVTVEPGQRLFREGAEGRHMYVVIDGELVASLERDGRRVELSRMRRGDVVGEIALFGKARSADVEVVERARLLRLDEQSLARLAERRPRIAARVYRNLTGIVAERLFGTMHALR